MKKLITIIFLLCSAFVWSQEPTAGIRILSESKEIGREEALLKQTLDDLYYQKMDLLKEKIVAMIKKQSKALTDETPREEKANLQLHTRISLEEKNGKTYINYHIPVNSFEFKVTTPNIAFGIGASKTWDPHISIRYSVKAVFEIIQSGTMESIKVLNPKCSITDLKYSVGNSNYLDADKDQIGWWVDYNIQYGLHAVYLEFNEMGARLNDYLATAVKKNVQLLKELELDENRQLTVRADVDNNQLLFIHQYSKTGIAKRAASTRPADMNTAVQAVPAAAKPSTSASGIIKPARVTTIKKKATVN